MNGVVGGFGKKPGFGILHFLQGFHPFLPLSGIPGEIPDGVENIGEDVKDGIDNTTNNKKDTTNGTGNNKTNNKNP